VAWFFFYTNVAFLWHNLIGAVGVVVAGVLFSAIERAVRGSSAPSVEGGL